MIIPPLSETESFPEVHVYGTPVKMSFEIWEGTFSTVRACLSGVGKSRSPKQLSYCNLLCLQIIDLLPKVAI